MKNEDHKDRNTEQCRVTTLLTKKDKDALQIIAWKSGRSVSGYIRYLVMNAVDEADAD